MVYASGSFMMSSHVILGVGAEGSSAAKEVSVLGSGTGLAGDGEHPQQVSQGSGSKKGSSS